MERDTETLIDQQLRNLGWVDNPRSPDRNVWKQKAKTEKQQKALGRLSPDYILYESGTSRPLAVIEAKRPNRDLTSAIAQATEYSKKLKNSLVFATDGTYITTFHIGSGKPLFKDGEQVEEFLTEEGLKKFHQKDTNEIQTQDKRVIQSRKELIEVLEQANKILRSEGIQSGHGRFYEFASILFLKLVSEMESLKEGGGVPGHLLWDSFRDKDGAELLDFVNDSVIRHFAKTYGANIFKKMEIKRPGTLKSLIDLLDPLQLTDVNADIKGDAFEFFIRKYISSQNNDLGEYFTPRHIVKACVKIAHPLAGEKIYDPFCGTGGMLIEAFRHIYGIMDRSVENVKTLKEKTIYGGEITANYKIARMNMILVGDGHNNISRRDSLESLSSAREKYDVVITNMPFSQRTAHGGLYDLPTTNGNSICIQHCIKAINPNAQNGRIVLICGDDVLSRRNQEYDKLREYIFSHSRVDQVVSLPPGVFSPYSDSVKTNILCLKDVGKKVKQRSYWFFRVKKDGYTFSAHRRPDQEGNNDLDILLLHQRHKDHEKFSEVGTDSLAEQGYVLSPSVVDNFRSSKAVALGAIIHEAREKAGAGFAKYKVATVAARARLRGGVVLKKDYYTKEFQSADRSNYKIVPPGYFVYRKEGADIGNFGWNRFSHPVIVSPIYVVFSVDEDKVLHNYLFNVLRHREFTEAAGDAMKGVARSGLKFADLCKLKIPLPALKKQREIARLESEIIKRVSAIDDFEERIKREMDAVYRDE